jgi:hypothetical protein
MSETALKREIVDALNKTGLCRVWSTPSGKVQVRGGWMYLAPEGTPDVCGFARDGRFVGIEIKVPKHKTKADRAEKQLAMQHAIRIAGGISAQVESVDQALTILRSSFNPNTNETP